MTGCDPGELGSAGSSGAASSAASPAGGAASPAAAAAGDSACVGTATTVADALKVITEPIGCAGGVNTFWSKQLGSAWTVPRFVPYQDGQVPADQCGAQDNDAADFKGNAFYCRLDDTVAYSQDFMQHLFQKGGPSYPMFVLMHELGHRVTRLTGKVGVVSRSEENQADCLAGTEARFAHDGKRLPLGDVARGALLFFSLGDSWFVKESPSDDDAHGQPQQRALAFGTGYRHDIDQCFTLGRSPTGSVPLTGAL
jgi:uncharacterized protein